MARRRRLMNIVLSLTATALFLLAIEAALVVHKNFQAARPKAAITESLLFPGGVSGEYVGAFRATENQCWRVGDPTPTRIMLFGGSTTYGYLVDNWDTWASHLQTKLCRFKKEARPLVLNFGVNSFVSEREVARLRYELTNGNFPTVAVFYNGVNDVDQNLYFRRAVGSRDESPAQQVRAMLDRTQTAKAMTEAMRAADALKADEASMPEALRNEEEFQKAVAGLADHYERNMREAKSMCDAYGIRMFVFLQPALFTLGRPRTAREEGFAQADWERHGVSYPVLEKIYRAAYAALRPRIEALRAAGIHADDLSGIFDAVEEPVYIDYCHVNALGNRLVADAVYERLAPELP